MMTTRRSGRVRVAVAAVAALFMIAVGLPGARQSVPGNGVHRGGTATDLPDGRRLEIGGADVSGRPTGPRLLAPGGRVQELGPAAVEGRQGHSATLLADGRVAVLGGVDNAGNPAAPLLFLPDSDSFVGLQPDSRLSRVGHTATILPNGKVLIVGGRDANGLRSEAVVWDPSTGNIEASGPTRWPHSEHNATLLGDGSVYLADSDGTRGEIFRPEANAFLPAPAPPRDAGVLALLGSEPADGAVGVSLDARLVLRLTRPLGERDAARPTVTVTGPTGEHPIQVVVADAGRVLFVNAREPWAPGTSYRLRLWHASQRPLSETSFSTISEDDGAELTDDGPEWQPNLSTGEWRLHRGRSSWQGLPPLQASEGETALSGQLLRLDGRPLVGATLELGSRTARTDNTGRFLLHLEASQSGRRTLFVDGRSAVRSGGTYGTFEVVAYVTPGRTNPLRFTIWMPRLDMKNSVRLQFPLKAEAVITTPKIPGLELHLPPGTVVRDRDGKLAERVSITPIPLDRPPFPLPDHVDVPIFFTIQPGGAYVYAPGHQPARLVYPNYGHVPTGRRFDFWHYDPRGTGWYVYGQGNVLAPGRQVFPDPGVGIYQFTGAMVSAPSNAPATAPGDGPTDGDPIDLSTGIFVSRSVDITLPDVIPLTLVRTYRTDDTRSRAFGIGASHTYDVFLVGDHTNYTYADLVLADGRRIRFLRTSPGNGYGDAVFEHFSSPTIFYAARMVYASNGWDLRLKDGTVWHFPDSDGFTVPQRAALLSIRDRYGNTVNATRNASGDLTTLTSPNGRYLNFGYDAAHRIVSIADNAGRSATYEYDASGRLWKATDLASGVTEYTYDAAHRLLTTKDQRGVTRLSNTYDSFGRVASQTLPNGGAYGFAYTVDASGDVTSADATNPRGFVRHVTFDSEGYALIDTKAVGQLEAQTVTRERNAASHLVTAFVDGLGRRDEYTYDALGNVTHVVQRAGTIGARSWTATYESVFNQLSSVTDPAGGQATFERDSSGRLTAYRDPLQNQTSFSYDVQGRVIQASDHLGNAFRLSYELTDLTTVTSALGRTWKRFTDGAGRVVGVSDPMGKISLWNVNNFRQVTKATDANGAETTFQYDPTGNLLSISDARGHATGWAYDDSGRATTRTDALAQVDEFEHDLNGNVTRWTARDGRVTVYEYDPLDRLVFIGYGAVGSPVTYTSTISNQYDAADRLVKVTDSASGVIERSYDPFDGITSELTPDGEITYESDNRGRRTGMTVAGDAPVTYSWDAAERLIGIAKGSSAVTITYDNLGRRTNVMNPAGVSAVYGYDADSRLTSVAFSLGATQLGALTYDYDLAGRRIAVGGTLASVSLPGSVASAGYDAANRLTTWAGGSVTNSATGDVLQDAARTYTWNERRQLVSVAGTTNATFAYDGVGRRVAKSQGGTTTRFLHDGTNPVRELVGGVPSASVLTGLEPDEWYARWSSTGMSTFLTDALGSVVGVTDAMGAVQVQNTYEPFGRRTASAGSAANPFGFTGREADSDDLYYFRARYYSATQGRFLSEDPLGFVDGANAYAYALNAPLTWVDPLGLSITLPKSPGELGPEWKPDPSHQDPNGQRFRDPSGRPIDWHPGRKGLPGWKGKDHWHDPEHSGERHLPPGSKIPDSPAPDPPPQQPAPEPPPPPGPAWPWLPWRMPFPLPMMVHPCVQDIFAPGCREGTYGVPGEV